MCKTLHIFNPGHDLALAADIDNFTPPHAARALRASLDYLPALWAKDGDAVLVDDIAHARRAFTRVSQHVAKYRPWHEANVDFIEVSDLRHIPIGKVEPWGWDRSLAYALRRRGVDEALLPDAQVLCRVREESHRRTALQLLSKVGLSEAFECSTLNEIHDIIYKYNKVVAKAPWSSSGRGIRFLGDTLDEHTLGWLRNTLAQQGSVMVEPLYNKVLDFGMEFIRHDDGKVEYLGLSLFQTVNGTYTGNMLATEAVKREMLSHYISLDELDAFTSAACVYLGERLTYAGHFGIDMMAVEGGRLALAEINLRRTMGHVALAISPLDDDIRRVMRILTGNICKLSIHTPQRLQ
ncbi:MAG: hypothetical protein ACI4T5_03315 [Prevotella sp.]